MKLSKTTTIKYLACSYFLLIGILNLIDSLRNGQNFLRDWIILLVLALPIVINKRLFHLFFGIVAALATLPMTIVFLITSTWIADDSPIFYLIGSLIFAFGIAASLALIYVGTYTSEKNKFRLI